MFKSILKLVTFANVKFARRWDIYGSGTAVLVRRFTVFTVPKVIPLGAPEAAEMKRFGFLTGYIRVPDDFDRMGVAEIEQLFGASK